MDNEQRRCGFRRRQPESKAIARLHGRISARHRRQRVGIAGKQPASIWLLAVNSDPMTCVAAKLRPGNVSSADDWEELLVPEIDRQQAEGRRVAFRADAAFARPEIYEVLEARGVQYAIRIPANKNLDLAIEDLLFRSPGRPSRTPLASSRMRLRISLSDFSLRSSHAAASRSMTC